MLLANGGSDSPLKYAQQLREQGKFKESAAYCDSILSLSEEASGLNLSGRLSLIHCRAKNKIDLGYFLIAISSLNHLIAKSQPNSSQKQVYQLSLAHTYLSLGDCKKALEDFLILEKSFDETNDSLLSELYFDIAACYSGLGDHVKTFTYLDKARISANLNETSDLTDCLVFNGLGIWYYKNNEYDKAKEQLQLSLDCMTQKGVIDYYRIYSERIMAFIFLREKKYTASLHHFLKAEKYLTEIQPEGTHEAAMLYKFMSMVYHALGEKDKRDAYYNKSLHIFKRGGPKQVNLAKLHIEIGFKQDFYEENYELGLWHYQQALDALTLDFTANREDFWANPKLDNILMPHAMLQTLKLKAGLWEHLTENNPDTLRAAYDSYQLGCQLMEKIRMDLDTETANEALSVHGRPLIEGAVRTAFKLHQVEPDQGWIAKAFFWAEQSKSYLLMRSLSHLKEGEKLGMSDSLLVAERKILADIDLYQREIIRAALVQENDRLSSLNSELILKQQTKEQLLQIIKRDHPAYFSYHYAHNKTQLKDLQEAETPAQACIMYTFEGKYHLYVFGIYKEKSMLFRLRLDAARFHSRVDSLYQLMATPPDLSNYPLADYIAFQQLASGLYEEVVKKVIDFAPASQHLLVIPDGCLNRIPIGLLLEKAELSVDLNYQKLPFLIKKYPIQYAFSGQMLLENLNKTQAMGGNEQCLAMAPFSQKSGSVLRSGTHAIPATSRELDGLAEVWEGDFLKGKMANKQAFLALAPQYRMLHLATHAEVNKEQPLLSYLKFEQNMNASGSDNLYAYELAGLSLKAELTVLSACETGVGPFTPGEGIWSLGRSFLQAGSRAVVMSLWRVEDRSSAALMPIFYQALLGEHTKSKALQSAKIESLSTADPLRAHPFYWGAFISLGNDESLDFGYSMPPYLSVVMVLFFLFGLLLFIKYSPFA